MTSSWQPRLGAVYLGENRCRFRVWAPRAKSLEVQLTEPDERTIPMQATSNGYFELECDDIAPGSLYLYRIDGEKSRPDPVSRLQPQGVHGPSAVVERHFDWTDSAWFGLPLAQYVLYELHPGTFSKEGTLDAIVPFLDDLKVLGVTALSLLPVAQNPGERNWGYDGVQLHAVQHSYGGPKALQMLVNAAHEKGLAVVLDVVYNHLGPEGNYLWDYGYYFTDGYKTPWGPAVNYDGEHSDEVRRFFLENVLSWMTDFHIDGLRLDAVHAIKDFSAYPFLAELADVAQEQALALNRRFYLIAESDLNDTRMIRPAESGGYGMDSQWSDSLHHAVHCLLTGESRGYYVDYGRIEHLERAYRTGFSYEGQYSAFRKRRYGNSAQEQPAQQFVVYVQNHDQVGNRMLGDRLGETVSFEASKLAAATYLLSPYLPMLFMGEEYGETAPFPYFTSHGDPGLIEAVRNGRREEFASFDWEGEPPDPQAPHTFESAKLNWNLRDEPRHRTLLDFYRELLRLRREHPALANLDKQKMEVRGFEKQQYLTWRRWLGDEQLWSVLNYNDEVVSLHTTLIEGTWEKVFDSTDSRWEGEGTPHSDTLDSDGEIQLQVQPLACVLYRRKEDS